MTDVKTIKQLIKLMTDNDITELDLQDEGEKIKLRRGKENQELATQYISAPPSVAAPPQIPAANTESANNSTNSPEELPPADEPTIDSPMVGTFYSAATPDAKPFVSVGDTVEPDTVVCIVEAMKVFNEIKAEKSGTIEKILVTNGQAVEFGEPIFVIKPS